MKTPRKSSRSLAIALALAAGLFAGVALSLPTPLRAQAASPSELASEKMQLELQALDAKTAGDFVKAKELLNKIITLDPKDPNNAAVQQQIALLDVALASQGSAKAVASDSASTAAPAMTARQLAASDASASTGAASGTAAPAVGGSAAASVPSPVSSELQAAAAIQASKIAAIRKSVNDAKALEASGDFSGARDALDAAKAQIPAGLAFSDIRNLVTHETANTWYLQAAADYKAKKLAIAKDDLAKFVEVNGGDDSRSKKLAQGIAAAENNPLYRDIDVISPGFTDTKDKIDQLLITGRAQYLYGDLEGAKKTFNQVIVYSPNNIEAKAFMLKIDQMLEERAYINRAQTRENMIAQVDNDWFLPVYNQPEEKAAPVVNVESPEMNKLKTIIISLVDIQVPTPLEQVAQVLHDASVTADPEGKGVVIQVFVAEGDPMPKITLAGVTNQNLADILNIACEKAGYSFGPERKIIAIRKGSHGGNGGSNEGFTTEIIGLSDGAKELLGVDTGSSSSSSSSPADTAKNPFDASASNTTATSAPSTDTSTGGSTDLSDELKKKFMDNGIDFPPGSSLTMLGKTNSRVSVSNTPENIANLRRYLTILSDVKQVQIESRFLDVTQSALKEFGTRWQINNPSGNTSANFLQTGSSAATNNLESLGTAFGGGAVTAAPTVITGLSSSGAGGSLTGSGLSFLPGTLIDQQTIPTLPGALSTAQNASDTFGGVFSWLDGYRIQMVLDMLDQESGTDLMTSPKLTVMDDTDANMKVAQEFRYPNQFQAVTATVSPASGGNSGAGGGIAVAAGNPNDFQTQDIGVVMSVHPKVQPDDSIQIEINPTVTQFDGFVEYGSASIAIQGNITAVVPSGVIEPIFDVRTIKTVVTVSDGATVVMGGMTRDEVDTVNDKVPGFGDIPIIGRLFQSKGETSQKRNLLIFVTCNLIGPGGSPALQNFQNLQPGTIFTNPTLVLPSGSFERTPAKELKVSTPSE